MYVHVSYMATEMTGQTTGFHPLGGGRGTLGGAPPPPPPKKEREKEEGKEREMVGGEHVYFCIAVQVISIVSYFMTI